MLTVLANSVEWVWWIIERIYVEQEAIACIYRQLYSKQQHSTLQEGRRDGGNLPSLSLKTPKSQLYSSLGS
jgi:hypothetical protein